MGKFTGEFRAAPWLPENAIALLDQLIQPEWSIIETGSGASTFWIAERARSIVSFEHNPAWGGAVTGEACRRGIRNAVILTDEGYPRSGLTGHLRARGIRGYDLALIDGRGRVRSVETAIPFIRPGGWIVLDNANRPRYGNAHLILADQGWKTTIIEGLIMPEKKRGFTQFWRKPSISASKQPGKMRVRISVPQTDTGEGKGA
uniref:Putative methyltransferase n=1 Tax=viral metagenome TaxID=1070528 RepID=A0A6M3M457_9ZZZZ